MDTIEVPGPDGATFTYTGPVEDRGTFVIVSPTQALTNWHVVHEHTFNTGLGKFSTMTLEFFDGSKRLAKVLKTDSIKDLALIEFNEPLSGPLHRIGIAKSFESGKMTMGGYQLGETYKEETASKFELIGDNWFIIDVVAIQGQSGSPIISEDGLLVGLLWGSDYPEEELAYCVRIDAIRGFLEGTGILELKGN